MCLHNKQLTWKLGTEELHTSWKEEISFLSVTVGKYPRNKKHCSPSTSSVLQTRRGEAAGETGGNGSSLICWTSPHLMLPHTYSSAALTTGCLKAHSVSRDGAQITFTSCSCLILYSACLHST